MKKLFLDLYSHRFIFQIPIIIITMALFTFRGHAQPRFKPKNPETIASYIKRPVTMADGRVTADVIVGFKTNTGRTVMVSYSDMLFAFLIIFAPAEHGNHRDKYKMRKHADITGKMWSAEGATFNNVPINKFSEVWPSGYPRFTSLYSTLDAKVFLYKGQREWLGTLKAGTSDKDLTFYHDCQAGKNIDHCTFIINNVDVSDFYKKYRNLHYIFGSVLATADWKQGSWKMERGEGIVFPLDVPVYADLKAASWLKSNISGDFVQLNKKFGEHWIIRNASSPQYPEGLGLLYQANIYDENATKEVALLTIGGHSVLVTTLPYIDYAHKQMKMPKVKDHPSLPKWADSMPPSDKPGEGEDDLIIEDPQKGAEAKAIDDVITVSMADAKRGKVFMLDPLKNDVGEGIKIVKVTDTKSGKNRVKQKGQKIRYSLKKKSRKLNYRGTEIFSYTIRDKDGNTSTAEVRLSITD